MNRLVCASLVTAALAGCGGGGGGGGGTIAVTQTERDPSVQPAERPVTPTSITIGDTFTPDNMDTPSSTGSAAGEFNYQSYGAWARGDGDNVLTRAMSTGPATPGNSIPTTGTATYTGTAKGFFWVNGNAQRWPTTANMNAQVDFSQREVGFATSNTTIGASTSGSGPEGPAPNLDLSGTLRYGAGNNDIRGTVTTRDTGMSGNAMARFYGPQAQEIGGVYRVEPAIRGGSGMTGGFGGKR
jgi:transferrin binding protein